MSTYSENTRSSGGRDGSEPNASDGTDELISRLQDVEANLGFGGERQSIRRATVGTVKKALEQGGMSPAEARRILGDVGIKLNPKPAGKDNPQPVADIGGVRSELDIARGLVEA
jgi:hypothetical protein